MPSLLLFPGDPRWVPGERRAFMASLAELGLIAAADRSDDTGAYHPGPEYLALVMFLGCSPRVSFDPLHNDEGQAAGLLRCHIYSEVRFVAPATLAKARCPRCRAPAGPVDVTAYDRPFLCTKCGWMSTVSDLDWRQVAGFGRCFLDIGGIHPHEAVPSDRLLESLRDRSMCDWRYCYTE